MRTWASKSTAAFCACRRLPPLCARHASAICAPAVITGLSEYFGSCMIRPARFPRMRRSAPSRAASTSMPSNSRRSAVTLALPGSSRRMERAVSDLPEPLSPTMPSFSWPTVSETPRTASLIPLGVRKLTRRLSIRTSINSASGRAHHAARHPAD
jgi:hypothetical protein